MPKLIQPSFAKGELSPELHGRIDIAAYAIGLAKARNSIIHTYGGVSRRPGTKWIGPVKDHSQTPRLIEFQFKTQDAYTLEFGHQYMRVIRDDGHVVEEEKTITGITKANPGVVTAASHGYSNGDEVFIADVVGMTQVNNLRFKIKNVTTDTFQLVSQLDESNINTLGFSSYSSGGTVAKIFEIETPYDIEDVFELNFVQSADVMTLVHKDYDIYELSRTNHDAWSLDALEVTPTLHHPSGLGVTVNSAASVTRTYRVTAISRETEEESLPGLNSTTRTITNITKAEPAVVTASSHGFANGDEIEINNVMGMTEVNGIRFIVANQDTNTFELQDVDGFDVDSSTYGTYISGGSANQTFVKVTNSQSDEDNTISWSAVDGAHRYAVYRQRQGIYGLIAEVENLSFTDNGNEPDLDITPPIYRNPFSGTNNKPGAVGYFEQRRVFGGSLDKPDTSDFSQTGSHANFTKSFPLQDDDSITATLNSLQVNEIRHYVTQNDLIVLTSGSEWRIFSGPDSLFGPDTIRQKPQSYWGSSHRKPIVAGTSVLFVSEDNFNVRSLGYSLELDGYDSSNLNILSRHLTDGYTINDWCYTRVPESRVYMIRSDGKVLTLTFDAEQEVIAWTHWDTSGFFEACSSLRGGGPFNEDSVFFVVRRRVNGKTVRYIEVMRQTYFNDVRDCFFVDSGLSYDDPKAITNIELDSPLVITSAAHGFSNGDEVDIFDITWEPDMDSLGNETQPDQLNGKRYVVSNKTTDTFRLTKDGSEVDGSNFNEYITGGTARKAADNISGLEHLEGRSVSCLADGNIISGLTVQNGAVELSRNFSRVHVGLPNIADVELLNIEADRGILQGSQIQIPKVVVRFFKTRGLLIGPDSESLVEMKQREDEAYGDPTELLTGDKEVILTSDWNSRGRVFMRQKDPLPLTVLAVIPTIEKGDD